MTRENNKQGTQEAIIDAAERLLDHYGYSKMTMTDLAAEAGIGVGTTYLYFPGKAEVALAVVERLAARIRGRLQEIADSPVPPADKVHAMLTERLRILYESARGHRHHLDDLKRAVQTVVEGRRADWMQAETAPLAKALEEGRHGGAFAIDDPWATAQALMLATSGLTPRNLSRDDFEHPQAFYDKAERVVALLVRGLERTPHVSTPAAGGSVCET